MCTLKRVERERFAQRPPSAGCTALGGILKVNSVLRYVGVDIGAAHRTGERASRWHVVKVFGVLQIVRGAELFVFG